MSAASWGSSPASRRTSRIRRARSLLSSAQLDRQLEREALALMAHPAGSGLGSGRERYRGGGGDRKEDAAHVVSIDRGRRLR